MFNLAGIQLYSYADQFDIIIIIINYAKFELNIW